MRILQKKPPPKDETTLGTIIEFYNSGGDIHWESYDGRLSLRIFCMEEGVT